ncbi:MAG: DnaJ domain-containing protein [Hyphomicrobiaceae bacterium]|nr:DnaJ domain-containing protein [Hyphomicrobiaceae bacterium]
MQYFLLGLAALLLALLALRGFTRVNVSALARQVRIVTGVAALASAAALMLRGLMSWAIPAAMLGVWMLWGGGGAPLGGLGSRSPGQTSRILTDHLEMELDHGTGDMRGRVLKGEFAGREIESMSPAEMAMLWRDCRFADVQSAHIIEAYLDRAHPSWREDMARAGAEPGPAPGAAMSREEAYEVLGLRPGAGEEEIRRAHRELMLKLHPDRGGSGYLAAKINLAKDVLLTRS